MYVVMAWPAADTLWEDTSYEDKVAYRERIRTSGT